MESFVVQCDFISGSNAQGCMVVLVGELGNITVDINNLEQNGSKIVNVSHPLSCYHKIFAFDIESDGSNGTLAVPGVIMTSDNGAMCPPLTTVTVVHGKAYIGTRVALWWLAPVNCCKPRS